MKSILDPTFRYTSSANTDLRKTFARIRRESRRQTQASPRDEAESTQKVTPMWDPPECFVAALDAPEKGVWLLKADGAIFALGGADYKGAANGKPYFVGRKAARLEASGDSYTIIATSGERYGPGF